MSIRSLASPLVTAMVAFGLGACNGDPANTSSDGSELAGQAVTVSVTDPAARYHVASRGVEATLPVTIRNGGVETVFFHPCGTSLERSVSGEWRRVWFMVCALGESWPATAIAPGEEVTVDVKVHAVPGETIATDWQHPIDGEYRILVAMNDQRAELPEAVRVSRTFTLRADTVR